VRLQGGDGAVPKSPDLPKYFIIAQDITASIRKGELSPGMQVPSENEIIERYHVSNTTARKALQEIDSGGWVVKIKGRGTYVRAPSIVRSVDRILSFTNNMIEMGYTPSTRLLHRGIVEEGYSATINGRQYSMKGPVYKIHRLRFANDIPMMLEVRYISMDLCPGIIDGELVGSLYDVYKNRYRLALKEVHQMLSTIMIDPAVDRFFDMDRPFPGFLVDGVTFCGREIILEMEKSIYRGDKYRFAVRARQSD
jgi:GntR family transcriptional regulator